MARVAVVLAGSGVKDGSEIHESTLTLLHLDEAGADVTCFAPDKPQMHVINHAAGEEAAGETRNCLVESARISRGPISPITELKAADFDAVVFPGGFGAAKNLCDYAVKGPDMEVDPEVLRVVNEFHDADKVKTFICITPVIAAKVFGGKGIPVKVTLGDVAHNGGDMENVRAMGVEPVESPVEGAVVDTEHKVVSTPAYQLGPTIKQVSAGIKEAIAGTLALI